jgi:hypothetical protein
MLEQWNDGMTRIGAMESWNNGILGCWAGTPTRIIPVFQNSNENLEEILCLKIYEDFSLT